MSDITVRDIVADYLKALLERGETRLPVDDSARNILVNWFKAARMGRSHIQTYGKPLIEKESHSSSAEKNSISALPIGISSFAEQAYRNEQALANEPKKKVIEPITLDIPEGTAREKLNFLYKLAKSWKPAMELGTLRNIMVFATGNPASPLMLIGEAPGYHEERQKAPFVGPAGEKLDQILKAMGLDRQNLYISNIVKFRPSMPRQTTNNRPPNEDEIASWLPFIMAEIDIVKPKVIVALGGTAAQGLLGKAASVSSLRGRFHEVQGIPLRVTYHPSYLLRSERNQDKRMVWEDMLAVMEKLDMPISEKQKGFFLTKD